MNHKLHNFLLVRKTLDISDEYCPISVLVYLYFPCTRKSLGISTDRRKVVLMVVVLFPESSHRGHVNVRVNLHNVLLPSIFS